MTATLKSEKQLLPGSTFILLLDVILREKLGAKPWISESLLIGQGIKKLHVYNVLSNS